MVADLVNQPGNSIGGLKDGVQGLLFKHTIRFASDCGNLGTNVGTRILAVHRLQVAASGDPLAERLQSWVGQTLVKTQISGQDQPDPRLSVTDEVGDHPDFFK